MYPGHIIHHYNGIWATCAPGRRNIRFIFCPNTAIPILLTDIAFLDQSKTCYSDHRSTTFDYQCSSVQTTGLFHSYVVTCASLNWSVFTTTEVSKYSLNSTEAMHPYEIYLNMHNSGAICTTVHKGDYVF